MACTPLGLLFEKQKNPSVLNERVHLNVSGLFVMQIEGA